MAKKEKSEILKRKAKKFGNSSHIILPKKLIGKDIKIKYIKNK